MQKLNQYHSALFISLVCLCFCLASSNALRKVEPVCFQILETSQLYLEGSTNVNSFTCDCNDVSMIPPLQLDMVVEEAASLIAFQKARLKIKTKNLDCGHRIMNNDLYDCLKASNYPYIEIELEKARLLAEAPRISEEGWTKVSGKAQLTVAGTTRIAHLKATARKLGARKYRFVCKHTINMTDYGIVPPSVFMGTVKVQDQITIHLDLVVEVE